MTLGTGASRMGSMFRLTTTTLALVFLLSAAGPGAVTAAESTGTDTVFILDASGSMNAKVQGKAKIDIAREVLTDLVKDLPAGIDVGLVAYGHREKDDCNDVEELVPLSPLDKKEIIGKIKAIQPKGKTPITTSIRNVAEGLRGAEREATIVLVSDGEETCEGDPCAAVRALKESGARFVLHVIGFDVNEKQKAQLSCVAEAGGGSYFTAKNAGELIEAARKVVRKAEETAGSLKVKALRNGKPFRAYAVISKTGDEEKRSVADGWTEEEGTAFKLLPGTYDLSVENSEDAGSPKVTSGGIVVEIGKSVEHVADFSGGTLRVKALRNGKPFRAYAVISKTGDEEKRSIADGWTEEEGTAFKLLPGTYDLSVENSEDAGSPKVTIGGIVVEAGKTVEKVADYSGGTLRVKALRNGKPFRAYAVISKAGEEEKTQVADGWTEEEGTAFKLLPGTYEVSVDNEEDAPNATVTFPGVVVEAGKSVEKTAEFVGGTIKVKALKNGKPVRGYATVTLVGEEETPKQVADGWIETEGSSFKLCPGTYDVAVEDEATSVRKEAKGMVVEAGKTRPVDIEL